MKRLPTLAVAVVLALACTGCGDTGITEQELSDAKREAFAQGRDAGYEDGIRRGRRGASERIADARAATRDAGFESGVDYVIHDLAIEPGQDYAIAFKQGRRGFFVKDSLPMKPGMTYECLPQTRYCTARPSGTSVPIATSEPAPTDPCEPSYPNVCLAPDAADYDCAGSGEDGPEYVDGRVVITGSDPFDLDGYPRDGVGCEGR